MRAEPTLDRSGRDVCVVVAKIAYDVALNGRVTIAFRSPRFANVGDGHGGVKYPSDLVDDKPGTDIGLVGTAFPPPGKNVEKQLAWLQAGLLRKVVTIFGPRRYVATFSGVAPGSPTTLGPTPLTFDQCFGGTDHASPNHDSEPFNPRGKGFAVDLKTLVGKEAPALEPAGSFRGDATGGTNKSHGCFAPIPETFEPRRGRAGTHDATWSRSRAPVRPLDFDVAHNAWAMPELRSEKPLPTETPFEVGGVLAEGIWRFKLPVYGMEFDQNILGEVRPVPTHLDSVLIDADERVVELTMPARASILPRKWEMLERIVARGVGDMPKDVLDTNSGGLPSESASNATKERRKTTTGNTAAR